MLHIRAKSRINAANDSLASQSDTSEILAIHQGNWLLSSFNQIRLISISHSVLVFYPVRSPPPSILTKLNFLIHPNSMRKCFCRDEGALARFLKWAWQSNHAAILGHGIQYPVMIRDFSLSSLFDGLSNNCFFTSFKETCFREGLLKELGDLTSSKEGQSLRSLIPDLSYFTRKSKFNV